MTKRRPGCGTQPPATSSAPHCPIKGWSVAWRSAPMAGLRLRLPQRGAARGTSRNSPTICPRIECWVHVRTGLTFDEQGQVKNLEDAAWREQRDRLASLGGVPGGRAAVAARPHPVRPRTHRAGQGLGGAETLGRGRGRLHRGHPARPLDTAVRLERAGFYMSRSQPEKAAEDYARALRPRQPRPKAARHNRGQRTVVPARRREPSAPPRPSGRSTASSCCRNRAGTRRPPTLRGSLSFCRGSPLAVARSARALALARWDRAYARLLELRPDDGQLWSVRGRYHALRDQWDLAAADFARGIRRPRPTARSGSSTPACG